MWEAAALLITCVTYISRAFVVAFVSVLGFSVALATLPALAIFFIGLLVLIFAILGGLAYYIVKNDTTEELSMEDLDGRR